MAYTGSPFTVYNAISATPTVPFELILSGQKGFKLETSGTSTSRTINFKVKLNQDSVAKVFSVMNFTTGDFVQTTTGINEVLDASGLEGLYSIIIDVSAIGGGNLTVLGKWY